MPVATKVGKGILILWELGHKVLPNCTLGESNADTEDEESNQEPAVDAHGLVKLKMSPC